MGDGPIQPFIQPVTIETMLNNNGSNIGDGLNFITSERSLRPVVSKILCFNAAVGEEG